MRSKLCHFHFMEQAVRNGKKAVGNAGNAKASGSPGNAGRAGGNPGNAGNRTTGTKKIKAEERSVFISLPMCMSRRNPLLTTCPYA